MRKLSTVTILLFIFCLNVKAQAISSADSTRQFLSVLKKTNADGVRLNILVKLGSYYLYKPGEIKSDLDSADLFLEQAKDLSANLKIAEVQNKITYLKAEVLFERGDKPKARMAYLVAIDNYTRCGDKEGAAHVWVSIAARNMYSTDSTGLQGLHAFEHALSLYRAVNDKVKEADMLKYLGDRHYQQGNLDQAENELLAALRIYKSIGFKNLHYTYDLLTAVSYKKGDFTRALYYGHEMIKSMQATADTAQAFLLYIRMASVYISLNEFDKSKYWFDKALIKGAKDPGLFYSVNSFLFAIMIKNGRQKDALELLLKIMKTRPPVEDGDKYRIVRKLAECYSLLGKDDLAEKYYKQEITFAERTRWKDDDPVAYREMGEFYFSRKRYGPARFYLQKVLAVPRGISDVETVLRAYLKLFKTDSATGNYVSAIKYYQAYQTLTDSVFTVDKAKQIARLQLQFEQDQKVQQLEDKGKLQQAELQQARTVKNFIMAGAGLLFLLLAMGYWRYRQKQHSNLLLQAQQQKINQINQSLQLTINEKDALLKEKDSLLTEKDWLLKEVHHRVKNNLHTVICLLESQELYLEDDALEAIEICQRRIYAMSLIHQKLYQSEDIEMVDMSLYIKEFVQYLADSFGTPSNISIRSIVEPTTLGIAQAIPSGLILNEAVTNAFKYAFPDNKPGEIFIGLAKTGKNMELIIEDNGVGIQHLAEETEPPRSLGIELMKGLSNDLKGNISFDTGAGTRISVIFPLDSLDGAGITEISSKRSSIVYDN